MIQILTYFRVSVDFVSKLKVHIVINGIVILDMAISAAFLCSLTLLLSLFDLFVSN